MKKLFDLNTLIIIIGLGALVYLGYHNFYLENKTNQGSDGDNMPKKEKREPKIVKINRDMAGKRGEDIFSPDNNNRPLTESDIIIENGDIKTVKNNQEKKDEKDTEKEQTDRSLPPLEENRSPADPKIPEEKLIPEEKEYKEDQTPNTPGYYKNETYGYSLSYPKDWPIRIRSANNISVGTVPPKNGQGAITIEVASDMGNEIEEAKTEAQRYPGIINIEEKPIIIDGTSGTKMTLHNSTNGLTDVYIYLEKGDRYYAIKYSEESPSFVREVEESLTSFKFTK